MTNDIRWPLVIVAGFGVVLNTVMLYRLNRDVGRARNLGLLDTDRGVALSARRRQSFWLLFIAICLMVSAFYAAGSDVARLCVFLAACAIDWKSLKLFDDRFKADLMVSDRLRRRGDYNRDGGGDE